MSHHQTQIEEVFRLIGSLLLRHLLEKRKDFNIIFRLCYDWFRTVPEAKVVYRLSSH